MIGVAFVAGTYILTDTTFAAFDEIFSDSLKGTDVVITAHDDPVEQESGEEPSFRASRPRDGARRSGSRLASGAIFTPGGLFDEKGDKIGSKFAPKFISSRLPGRPRVADLPRRPPAAGRDRASLDKSAAEEAGIGIGRHDQDRSAAPGEIVTGWSG